MDQVFLQKKKNKTKRAHDKLALVIDIIWEKCHKRYCLYVLGMEYTELLGKLASSIGYRVNGAWSIEYLYQWIN